MDSRVRTFRALAHPVRLQLLSLLTGSALSAAEAARELGLSQAGTSYHLRTLERAGLVQVTEEVEIRGGRARRYRQAGPPEAPATGPEAPDSAWWTREAEKQFVALVAAELRRRYSHRVDGPGLNVDADLWVDAQVWQDVVDTVEAASATLHAAALPARSPDAVRVSMTASLFRTAAR